MIFCGNCEEYTESYEGRCIACNEPILEGRKKKIKLDEFEDNSEEWGTEDEAEEIREKGSD